MSSEFVIGLDIGTTSVKACVFTLNGKLVADVEKLNTSFYPHQGWVEQDPIEIEQSAILAIREVIEKAAIDRNELVTIGFSAAMHSLVCIDEEGTPISPALIWADGRSYEQAEKIINTRGDKVYSQTGTPIHPMTPFVKLVWMKETEYEPYKRAQYFMSIKEYLLQCWFGKRVIDYSMASATGLFNPETHKWEQELLELAGIKEKQLSEIVPPTKTLTGINQAKAEEMGINPQMPFA